MYFSSAPYVPHAHLILLGLITPIFSIHVIQLYLCISNSFVLNPSWESRPLLTMYYVNIVAIFFLIINQFDAQNHVL